jgi:hypothetical protein
MNGRVWTDGRRAFSRGILGQVGGMQRGTERDAAKRRLEVQPGTGRRGELWAAGELPMPRCAAAGQPTIQFPRQGNERQQDAFRRLQIPTPEGL